jgi:hypothetical protein
VTTGGLAADDARRDFSELISATGHVVDNARLGLARLRRAFDEGALHTTPAIEAAMADLDLVLAQDEGQRLGGKSAEAARFITRRLETLLAEA